MSCSAPERVALEVYAGRSRINRTCLRNMYCSLELVPLMWRGLSKSGDQEALEGYLAQDASGSYHQWNPRVSHLIGVGGSWRPAVHLLATMDVTQTHTSTVPPLLAPMDVGEAELPSHELSANQSCSFVSGLGNCSEWDCE